MNFCFFVLGTTHCRIQDGKSSGESQSIQDVLDRLKRTAYPLSELQVRPPPEGVDPTKLESYLTDDDFQVRPSITTFFFHLFDWLSGHPLLTPSSLEIVFCLFLFFCGGLRCVNPTQETMGMSKMEFYALPAWRQTQLRKETGLF